MTDDRRVHMLTARDAIGSPGRNGVDNNRTADVNTRQEILCLLKPGLGKRIYSLRTVQNLQGIFDGAVNNFFLFILVRFRCYQGISIP